MGDSSIAMDIMTRRKIFYMKKLFYLNEWKVNLPEENELSECEV